MGKKYLVVAGRLPKRNRNELRGSYVSSDQLIQLYKVNRNDCEIYTGEFLPSEMQGLIALEPDPTGLYVLPTQKIGEAAKEITDAPKPDKPLSLSKDGNQWVVLYGADLQSGTAGYGDTPEDALKQFAREILQAGDAIGLIIRDVAELPDRTSPEDRPDMMLVSGSELKSIVGHHLGVDTFELSAPPAPVLKAYEMDDECTTYAGMSAEDAKTAYLADMGDDYELDDDYPCELTDNQLDFEYPDCDEDEKPNGKTFTIRQMLAERTEAGYLCGGAQ